MTSNEHLERAEQRSAYLQSVADLATENPELAAATLRSIAYDYERLAAQLAASEARAERWKRYALALRAYEDAGNTPDREAAVVAYDEALDELEAHGDLPAEEGAER